MTFFMYHRQDNLANSGVSSGHDYSAYIMLKYLVFCPLSVGPSISPGPFNVTVTTGIRAVLSCETTGIPPPKVSWRRNGTPLDNNQQLGAYR